jgi:hypothetical protein
MPSKRTVIQVNHAMFFLHYGLVQDFRQPIGKGSRHQIDGPASGLGQDEMDGS